ncbi:hypothetical protein Efla_006455 [Eimeria flavescens]
MAAPAGGRDCARLAEGRLNSREELQQLAPRLLSVVFCARGKQQQRQLKRSNRCSSSSSSNSKQQQQHQ